MSLEPAPTPRPAYDSKRRRLENAFILAFLALQIVTPLSYYLGGRDYDERFSWRMFSTLRLRDCTVRVLETSGEGATPQPVAIDQDVQAAWIRLLERMRSAVVDKYLERRCKQANVWQVEYIRTCKDTDGQPMPPVTRSLRCDQEQTR
jgi:hypothetical protein